jgi:hypothetical protein
MTCTASTNGLLPTNGLLAGKCLRSRWCHICWTHDATDVSDRRMGTAQVLVTHASWCDLTRAPHTRVTQGVFVKV